MAPHKAPPWTVWCVMILTTACNLPISTPQTTVMSSSRIERCDKSQQNGLRCDQKMTVQLVVRESIAGVAAEQYNFTVRCVESGTTSGDGCPCDCNRDTDRTCRCTQFADPISITVTKSPVYLQYPLVYLKSVNGKPYEEVINTGGSSGNKECEDRSAHNAPTCGWVVDERGQRILGSQGFCCNCKSSEVFREGVGLSSFEWKRSQRVCNLFANGVFKALFSTPGAAICMRLNSTNWYEAFSIGLFQVVYTIEVRVQYQGTTDVLRLGPRNRLGVTSNRLVEAQLVGDFASFSENPSLQDHTLFIPAVRQDEFSRDRPRFVARRNKDQWLLIPNSAVDLTGSSPNKPGVDFTGWSNDLERCERPVGWGLRNQLTDMFTADWTAASRGVTPRYLIGRFYATQSRLAGAAAARDFAESRQLEVRGSDLRLNLPQPTPAGSAIVLSVAADDLRVVRKLGSGRLLSVQICRFEGASCGESVEAMTGAFYAYVNVTNDGSDDAEFQVAMVNCTDGLMAPVAKTIVLPYQTSAQVVFELYSTTDQASAEDCAVTLSDASGAQLQASTLQVLLNATQYDFKPMGTVNGTKNPGVNQQGPTLNINSSCSGCSWFNIICVVMRRCIWDAVKRILILLAIVLGVVLAAPILLPAASSPVVAHGETKRHKRPSAGHLRARGSGSSTSSGGIKHHRSSKHRQGSDGDGHDVVYTTTEQLFSKCVV